MVDRAVVVSGLRDRLNAAETVADGLLVIGTTLRLAAGGNKRRELLAAGATEAGLATFFDVLYPLTDGDIDFILHRLADQVERIVLQDAKVAARHADHMVQAAWRATNGMSELTDSDANFDAVRLSSACRQLGLSESGLQIMKMCDLILSCKPSAVATRREGFFGSALLRDADRAQLYLFVGFAARVYTV